MDALLSAALQEVAVEGIQGCSLPKLWARLQAAAAGGGTASSSSLSKTQLTARTKQMLWQQLLKIPGLLLLLLQDESAQTELLECSSPSIQSVEEAETLGVCMIAPEGLRDCCLGIYDLKFCDAHLSKDQRDILERLARARFTPLKP
jgi:general transcription factor 3C polypeptide 1